MPRSVLQTGIFLFSEVYACSYCAKYDTDSVESAQTKGFMLVSCRFHAGFRPDPADRSKLEFGDAEECVSKCGIPFLGRWMFAFIAPR